MKWLPDKCPAPPELQKRVVSGLQSPLPPQFPHRLHPQSPSPLSSPSVPPHPSEVCHAWEVFRLISHCLQEVTVDYMPQQGMWYTCVCAVFIKSTPLSLTHVGYDQCKQYGFIMTKNCHLCSVIFLDQTGSEENNFNVNVKPNRCAAIV